jgi:hypothetical protein
MFGLFNSLKFDHTNALCCWLKYADVLNNHCTVSMMLVLCESVYIDQDKNRDKLKTINSIEVEKPITQVLQTLCGRCILDRLLSIGPEYC